MGAARHRARLPFRVRCAGPVVLAYAPGDAADCQPFHDASSRTTLVIDGHIDNVDEMAMALATERSALAVVLSAWRRWGLDCGSHLLGDFVVVVSEETTRRVVCIRDSMGQRPLFYCTGPHGVVFASEVQQVVRHVAASTGVPPVFNDAMIAEYLSGEPQTVAETLWRGVYRLPPAHSLEITSRGTVVRRYWDFDPEARVEYAHAGEYAEHFRDVFTRAVDCRVRGTGPVGVFLSGGIDSSSVAGLAQAAQRAAGREAIQAFTVAFPGRPCDETVYSQAVVDKWSLPATRIDAAPPSRETLALRAAQDLDIPPSPTSLSCRSAPCTRRLGGSASPVDWLRRRRFLHGRSLVAARSAARGPRRSVGPGHDQPSVVSPRTRSAEACGGRASASPSVDSARVCVTCRAGGPAAPSSSAAVCDARTAGESSFGHQPHADPWR